MLPYPGKARDELSDIDLESIRARPVVLKLRRPVVARIATLTDWPLILIDLHTEEGVIGRSYLEPYIRKSMRYLIPALHDLGEMFKGRRLAPIEFYEAGRKSLEGGGFERSVPPGGHARAVKCES
jgi:mandelate racemase